MIISALSKDGKLLYEQGQPEQIKTFLNSNNEKRVYITFDTKKPQRTILQNNYLWGVVYKYIADDTGQTEEEIHSYCKQAFLPRIYIERNGNIEQTDKSTTRLNTKEMGQFLDQIIAWAGTEYSISIPEATGMYKLDKNHNE